MFKTTFLEAVLKSDLKMVSNGLNQNNKHLSMIIVLSQTFRHHFKVFINLLIINNFSRTG